ncbi:hypothetical protein [Streptacidiphilus sp. P02-A3a]|uniref:hypothetical protein n=1 Tax=Streptacidiphilus sp. P02-A3a TaxID=2704468 RepID=UPI0015FE0612|nr:hypothetical protein [Streptacidiphilus sp. P02-A3a]QMU69666.1 hypothetical protein GXP74_16895 [Streptacidiphilus sp. P02-A3a]
MTRTPDIVFVTARGTRYHASRHCFRLVNAQRAAKARGLNVSEPVPVPLAELSAGRKPCDCTLVEPDAMEEKLRESDEIWQRINSSLDQAVAKIKRRLEAKEGAWLIQAHPDLAALDAELDNLYPDARD